MGRFHVAFTKDELASGSVYYNYDMGKFPSEEGPGISVFYKGENGDIFTHILRLRTRHRNDYEHLQLSRPRAQRPRRTRFVFYHVVASPSRSLRGWLLSRSG